MYHYRDSKAGKFYLNDDRYERVPSPSAVPPFLRFADKDGIALDLWRGDGAPAHALLADAHLDWPVMRREVLVPAGSGLSAGTEATHYRALVRPDTEQVMSVVTSHYTVAENRWVAAATENFASRLEHRPPMIASVGFGRDGERTMFAARVIGDEEKSLCLLAHNTHGGEGALRFQLIEVAQGTGVTYVLDSQYASVSFSHVGDLEDRLERSSRPTSGETFIEKYLTDTKPLWERLENTLWTRRHTPALIQALWQETPDPTVGVPRGPQGVDDVKARHPGHHLPASMQKVTDAASAYRAVCDWIDNRSEACERGDFTKDRDERLALGAGNRYKRDAWRWILSNC